MEHLVLDGMSSPNLSPSDLGYAEEVERLQELEVENGNKETVSSRHKGTDTHRNSQSLSAHTGLPRSDKVPALSWVSGHKAPLLTQKLPPIVSSQSKYKLFPPMDSHWVEKRHLSLGSLSSTLQESHTAYSLLCL